MIIVLNGPPECGKDTIGTLLREYFPGLVTSEFKRELYHATAEYYDIPVGKFMQEATGRITKDKYSKLLPKYMTPREALIHVSEDIYKPKYGNDYFGRRAADRIKELEALAFDIGFRLADIVFTDGGFVEEIDALANYHKVHVVQLHGRGNFDNDSRSYISSDHPNVTTHACELVEGNPMKTVRDIESLMMEFKK